jgi:hypothetical protein
MATTLPGAPEAEVAAREGHGESDTQRRQRLRIVIAASLLGTTVEWYDFFLYATAAGLVFNKVFFPDASSLVGTLLAFATFAVGLSCARSAGWCSAISATGSAANAAWR